MTAVMVSTNMDKPKMVFAGVDAGAKIFVELNGELGMAADAAMEQNSNARLLVALRVAQLFPCRMFHKGRARSAAVCLAALTRANVTAVDFSAREAPLANC